MTDADIVPGVRDLEKGLPAELAAQRFAQGLGREIRVARVERGWSRRRLLAASGASWSVQALAAHEYARRAMSVRQFGVYCHALGMVPGAIVDRTYREAFAPEDGTIIVNVERLARSTHPGIARWANAVLREKPVMGLMNLSLDEQRTFAEACGFGHHRLIEILRAAAA